MRKKVACTVSVVRQTSPPPNEEVATKVPSSAVTPKVGDPGHKSLGQSPVTESMLQMHSAHGLHVGHGNVHPPVLPVNPSNELQVDIAQKCPAWQSAHINIRATNQQSRDSQNKTPYLTPERHFANSDLRERHMHRLGQQKAVPPGTPEMKTGISPWSVLALLDFRRLS